MANNDLVSMLAAMGRNPLPNTASLLAPRSLSSSEVVFDQVADTLHAFEETLSAEEEIGAYLVNAPGAKVMHIERVERRGREMIAFHGVNEHGKTMLLLQHCTQVNILLTALPKLHDTARRIGFDITEKASKPPEPPGEG